MFTWWLIIFTIGYTPGSFYSEFCPEKWWLEDDPASFFRARPIFAKGYVKLPGSLTGKRRLAKNLEIETGPLCDREIQETDRVVACRSSKNLWKLCCNRSSCLWIDVEYGDFLLGNQIYLPIYLYMNICKCICVCGIVYISFHIHTHAHVSYSELDMCIRVVF